MLFLVDRIPLARQTEDAFAEYLPDLPAYVKRAGRRFQDEKRITITTLQSMVNDYAAYSSGYFDLVISDECHRSIYGKWSGVLKHFDGLQIGLTATPCVASPEVLAALDDAEDGAFVRDTLRFFELDQPTYRYGLKQAIQEGFLVPYRIYHALTVKTAAEGGFPVSRSELDWSAMDAATTQELEALFAKGDPITVDPNALERRFTIPERNRAMVREFRDIVANGYTAADGVRRFPQDGKTIVFAVTKRHAATLAQMFDKAFADRKALGRNPLRRFRRLRRRRGRYHERHGQDQALQEGAVSAHPRLGQHARHRVRLPRGREPGHGPVHQIGHSVPTDAWPRHTPGR